MRQALDNKDGDAKAGLQSSGPTGAMPQPGGTRTAAAGREFLSALGSDLAAIAVRWRQYRAAKRGDVAAKRKQVGQAIRSAAQRGSFVRATAVVLRRFAIGIVVLATVGTLALFAAM